MICQPSSGRLNSSSRKINDFVRPPGRLPKAHLAGSVCRDVGFGRTSIENGFDLAGRRDDEFGMQEASIPGSTAAGRPDWHLDLIGQMRRDLLERLSQFQMRDGAGRVHGDPPEFPPDRQLRKQVATPCNRVDDGQTFVLGFGLGVEKWCNILAETESARCRINDDRDLAARRSTAAWRRRWIWP